MKRGGPPQRKTPLGRGSSPLKRTGGLSRTPGPDRAPAPALKRSRPKPKRKAPASPEIVAAREAWKPAVISGKRCAAPGCARPAEVGHHAPRRQSIEKLGGDPWDAWCGVPLCRRCHDLHHEPSGNHRLPRRILPAAVWAFVRAIGEPAVATLEREYPE